MASTYSPNLGIELIGTGEQSGYWGNTTNTNLGTLIEQAISGYVTQAVATGTTTAVAITNGISSTGRNMFIELTGSGGTNTYLTVPTNKKIYFIYNNTSTTPGAVTVKTPLGSGVSIPYGAKYLLVCNGTDVVKAVTAADLLTANTFTATQTFSGSSSSVSAIFTNAVEPTTVQASAATGTVTINLATQSILYYTLDATADWTVNIALASGTGLNSALAIGQAITCVFMAKQGTTAYKPLSLQVDGASKTVYWQGGVAPIAGNPSSIDVYTYTVIKTGTTAHTVLASQTQFKP